MCRSIKVLRQPGQAATPDEVTAAARQFVRKISGFNKPSRVNQEAFDRAILEISDASDRLLKAIGVAKPRAESVHASPPAAPQ